MSTLFEILTIICVVAIPVFMIIFVVKWIRKKPKKKIGLTCLACVIGLVVFSIVGSQMHLAEMTPEERAAYEAALQEKKQQNDNDKSANSESKVSETATTDSDETTTTADESTSGASPSESKNDEEPAESPSVTSDVSSSTEIFAQENDVSIAFAESLDSAVQTISDKYNQKFDINDVSDFKETNEWAYGKRYTIWLGEKYVLTVYEQDDEVVSIRKSNGDFAFSAD